MNIRSAFFPTSIVPISSSNPSTLAPSIVAIFSMSYALIEVGSIVFIFCKYAAVFISSNISNVVVLPIPSVPIPTFIPFFLSLVTSHIPDDNLQLLIGLCEIPPLICFNISKSESDI